MATLEWIEWGPGFARKREVVGIARILSGEKCPEFVPKKEGHIGGQISPRQIGRHEVAARFMEVMEWADHETTDGRIVGATPELIDELAGIAGFSHALNRVGWLVQIPGGIEFVNFSYHNGKSSKARKSAALKKKMQRLGGTNVPEMSPDSRDKNGTEWGTTVPNRTSKKKKKKKVGGETELAWSVESGWDGITDADRDAWKSAYPACDMDRQLAAMGEWLKANPEKARKSNWRRFVTNWLSKSQDRGGDAPARPYRPLAGTRGAVPNPDRLKGQFPEEVIRVPIS